MNTVPPLCPLCQSNQTHRYHTEQRAKVLPRDYLRCGNCALVFVPAVFHLDAAAEKAVYDQHQNLPDDAGYRKFLGRVFEPLQQRLQPGAAGLDFGCGPGPTLALMFAEAGFHCANYDLYYCHQPEHLSRQYDYIVSTEVVEHLSAPGQVLCQLIGLLKPGGWLGLMTKRLTTDAAFANWHYTLDPTHISFFADDSFRWLAARYQLDLEFCGPDVVLLQKPTA
ncbi:class I SAM-dependent methyltransferase [Alkalimonas mucilaginosa]|uniref:Class I SAM-dependent methyltransferase n=1 Tax=Alkalimonas mucilaginosa TaxID=3057676 RepID=A0ABU7JH41_9GAMM|nr:class I SAM-dependent methyltransferase [Alkalimonas sp. MEB004]MEE2025006.1 class I SAM-dependent methyltransferase [Alkalimonas sp. MEB004]